MNPELKQAFTALRETLGYLPSSVALNKALVKVGEVERYLEITWPKAVDPETQLDVPAPPAEELPIPEAVQTDGASV